MSDLVPGEIRKETSAVTVIDLQKIREENGYFSGVWDDEKLKIAVDGVSEYHKLIESLNEDLATKIKKDAGIQNCFLGSVPVQHFRESLDEKERNEIQEALALNGNKFLLISYDYSRNTRNEALINVNAASLVIQKNRDLFKDVQDIPSFLKNNYSDYLAPAARINLKIHDLRHGVLSGYLRENVDTWSEVNNRLGFGRFFNRPREFGVGDRDKGIYFTGFSEKDSALAREIIALRDASKINEFK